MNSPARLVAAAVPLVLLATCATVASQPSSAGAANDQDDYRVVRWTTAEGLPQNTVNDIVRLPNGELWLATFGGLARFDGDAFHVVDIATDEGMPANRVVSLAPASDEGFWFLTQQGHLGRVERGRAALHVRPPSAALDALALHVDPSGRIYAKTVDGSIWNTDGTQPWRLLLGSSDSGGMLHAFATTGEGEVWAGWGEQLVNVTTGAPGQRVNVPVPDPDVFPRVGGGIWVALERGLASLVDGRLEPAAVTPAIEWRVKALASRNDGIVWVGSFGGVSRLDLQPDGSWRQIPVPLGLPDNEQLRSLMIDGAGSLWVGTNTFGLYRVNRHPIRRFGSDEGLGPVAAVAADGGGGAFVVVGCRGVVHLAASGLATPVRLVDPDDREGVVGGGCGLSLATGIDGRAWVRAGPHLFRVDRERRIQRVRAAIPAGEGPVVANDDGSVWIVSRDGTVQRLSTAGVLIRALQLQPPLMSASPGPDGALWVGGDGEVFRVGRDVVERFGPDAHVPRGLVRDIAAEVDGTAWIGTYGGGVGRLRHGRVVRLTVEHGLPDNAVSRILDDGRGRFWIATNRGLAVVDREELHAAADGRGRMAPVVLGPERGVAEANFGIPAGFADARGQLWFGTIDGVASIAAADFPFNRTPPGIRIEGVWADERSLPVTDAVRIPPRTARVHVAFTSFGLRYPERVRFRFRVEGIDADWVDAGTRRTVDWTPPGPGAHRFVVQARNEDGVWSTAPAAVVLDVLPAWWQTTPFRAAVGLSGVLTVVATFRWRIRTIEHRHVERLRALEEQQAAEQRVASLRAQLEHVARVALAGELAASIAHEVSQPLGAIVNNAEAGARQLERSAHAPAELGAILRDIAADGLRASEVVRGLRGFLRPSGSEAVAIDLSALVREMLPIVRRELVEAGVEVELALANALPATQGLPGQLGQVVLNLVMNACEALAAVSGRRVITVATAARDGCVELAVRDNGPGLSPAVARNAFEPFVTTKHGGLGMGLAICRAIADMHGGHLSAHPAPGGGLEVVLSLPAVHTPGAAS